MFEGIDLFSDTVTRPTTAMKTAMVEAPLGDEQKGEDPTTRLLQDRVAKLLGKEAAIFLPSATMANQIAVLLFCERGDELIAAENAHILCAETGAPAVWAGAMARPIETPTGIFSGDDVYRKFNKSRGPLHPISRLVVVENTTNFGGGLPWSLGKLESVWGACRELGLKSHMDGSRFFNAVVALGESPARVASGFDSVTLCLSKGLGCPVGAVLAFESRHWDRVRRWKQCMGGSMRQSGMLAAAGLFALEHHIERLTEDHSNAKKLAEGLAGMDGLAVENTAPPTNMVYFRLTGAKVTPQSWEAECVKRGFRFSQIGENRFRAVTHLDVSEKDIDRVIRGVREITEHF